MNGMELSELEAAADRASVSGQILFQLGTAYSSGAAVPPDFVAAHKWFNLAAMRGDTRAAELRREIATQMSDAEVGLALRAARAWLAKNAPKPALVTTLAA